MGIKKKLTLFLLLLSLIPFLTIGIFAIQSMEKAIHDQIGASSVELLESLGARIKGEIEHSLHDVVSWAEDPKLIGSFDMLKELLEDSSKELASIILKLGHGYHRFYFMTILDEKGKVITGTQPEGMTDFSSEPVVKNALFGKAGFSGPQLEQAIQKQVVYFSAPIYKTKDTNLIRADGVLLVAFNWDTFSSIITSMPIKQKNQDIADHIMLAKKDGLIISCFDDKEMFKDNLISIGMTSAIEASKGKKGFVKETTEHGLQSFSAYSPFPDSPLFENPGWILVLLQDKDTIFSAPAKVKSMLLKIASILVFFVTAISLWMGRTITFPILEIVKTIKTYGKGEFNHKVRIQGPGEIATLGETFNAMADKLNESRLKLLESSQYNQAILDNMGDSLFVIRNGVIKNVNKAASVLLKLDQNNLVGMPINTILKDDFLKNIGGELALGKQGIYHLESVIYPQSGNPVPVLISCSFLFLTNSTENRNEEELTTASTPDLIVIVKDIHDRKKLEMDLITSQEKAINANMAKSQFLSNMSHEIRTPMNGIMGMTNLLIEMENDDQKREYLFIVKKSSESLLAILNDLLDLSKVESGNMTIRKEDFNIKTICNECLSLISATAHNKRVELLFNIKASSDSLSVAGDSGKIKQIIINLLGNAIKFTDAGEIELGIEEPEELNGNKKFTFYVRDTGVGIDESNTLRLFEPFYQVDSSLVKKSSGTGLGLAICKKIVNLMGGDIWVESKSGIGSTFFFTVVLSSSKISYKQTNPVNTSLLKDKRILIADDNQTNRTILQNILLNYGCKTLTAENGRGALNSVKEAEGSAIPFHIVIMDYVMPDMTGVEAIRLIQKEALTSNPLFFILSSTDRKAEISYSMKHGIKDYLMKPVKEEDLIKKIVSALEEKIQIPDAKREDKTENHSKLPNILVAEDQTVNQILAVTLLKRRGFKVTVAENGKEVIHALKNDNFDLILMDVQMPEMDGLEATRIIRTSKSPSINSEIAIIGVSAFAMEDDRRRCIEAGMNSHISKPIDKATLFNEIDFVLKNRSKIS